jgi:FKBP-type peptidyl-prolyl cis-trans isomerase 2
MVDAKKGDLVLIEYTGRVASTGQAFDTTDGSLARSEGIFDESARYGAKLALFGHKAIMQGLEEAIAAAPMGRSEDFMISPDKAFGKKLPGLVRMMPEKEFARQGVVPVAGMTITLDGVAARVKSVTSGRVVVDFNHPLAGESVLYSLKVTELISDPRKKIEAIASSLGVSASIAPDGGNFRVSFGKSDEPQKIEAAKSAILSAVPGTEFTVS